jgi:LDH2 family malate/lactate/ureidoglycolate dehydrogenase
MDQEIRVSHTALVAAIDRSLAGLGVPSAVREVEARIMAEADLHGVPSHGVRMLPPLIGALQARKITADPRTRLERDQGATCLFDGDRGPGRFVATRAMEHAIERARRFGVGLCLARHTSHWGRAHAYAAQAAQAGCIGVCATNAIPVMLAWGSSRPLLGNNPLAIGVPHTPDPVVLDLAMSQAAYGKIGTYRREGKKAPPGWGLDATGRPTDDPAAILATRKLLPMGDHKGAGLALMIELLTGALAGGLLSQEIAAADPTGQDSDTSKLFLAIDGAAFGPRDRLAARVDDMLAYLRTAEPEAGIRFPGERGWQTRARYLVEGIPVHAEIVDQLHAIGVRLPAMGA